MPIRFYPDTNVIHLISSSWKPAEFDERARVGGHILCLGHQTYELARSFLYDHSQQAVKKAFVFLSEIECIEYLPDVNSCIERELYLAKTGLSLVTVVGPLNRVATKQELLKLARGSADNACKFISKRENNVAKDKAKVTELNQAALKAAKAIDQKRAGKIKTFENLQKELTSGRSGWLKKFTERKGHRVTTSALDRILADPIKYPVLNTIVFTQEYLYYISAFHQTAPGKDTLDDFRNLVESAICDLFVTNDGNLVRQSRKIRPLRPALPWAEFKATLDPEQGT